MGRREPMKLRAVKRLGFPVVRRDVWPFILCVFPALYYITKRTWDYWHPDPTQILSENATYCLWHDMSPAVGSMFDAKLPSGVPMLYPFSAIPIPLLEPLLEANNLKLMMCAMWVLGFIALALSFLFPAWFPRYKLWAMYRDAPSLEQATELMIQDVKKTTFCRIQRGYRYLGDSKAKIQAGPTVQYHSKTYLIDTNAVSEKYVTVNALSDALKGLNLLPPQYAIDKPLDYYLDHQGFAKRGDVNNAKQVFGLNLQDIPVPEFLELFAEHAVQPLFVFQMFCMLLWLLDEYWQYSLMTLVILIIFEAQMVVRRRRDLSQIKSMHMPPTPVAVFRLGKWYKISSVELLPGDLFSMAMNRELNNMTLYPGATCPLPKSRFVGDEQSLGVPCDAVILRGSVVVNEAMLTGESLPQMKHGLAIKKGSNERFDMHQKDKIHTLYAGTSILTETADAQDDEVAGAVLYCLKTGFQTTQGKLIRTVLYSAERMMGSSREALLFLLILTVVAFVASGYVLNHSWGAPNRNHYKLLLHCVMIITSVVPPELPVTMSMTVTTSVNALFRDKLYCTEPFRIPLAGKLTYCCFDKTGTLTTSNVILEKHITPAGDTISVDDSLTESDSAKWYAETPEIPAIASSVASLVMGCCNSLIAVKKKSRLPAHMREAAGGKKIESDLQVVGDPLEKTASACVKWTPVVGRQDVLNNEAEGLSASVLKRFPFASEFRRMTVVVTVQPAVSTRKRHLDCSQPRHFVLIKGAPETVIGLCGETPEWFGKQVEDLALRGKRVLGMAWKELTAPPSKSAAREELESNMTFGGLLVYGCPIKNGTVSTVKALRESGHATVMITGDDPRTAAHIAHEVGMIAPTNRIWLIDNIVSTPGVADAMLSYKLELVSRDRSRSAAVDATAEGIGKFLAAGNSLVAVGQLLDRTPPTVMPLIACYCAVFARVTPVHKEEILKAIKGCGEVALMCGDGTNDVGALKAADVGVSLLNFDVEKISENKKVKEEAMKENRMEIEPVELSRKRRLGLGLNSKQIQQLEKMEQQFVTQRMQLAALPASWQNRVLSILYRNIVNLEERMAQNNLAIASGQSQSGRGQPTAGASSNPFGALEDFDDGQPMLRPGDASMASPFTYRGDSVSCVEMLVKMGKATLAIVMMNYKLMALNSLTTAFSLSVLTLNGVKFGDGQATIESLFVSVLYMSVSNAAAAKRLTQDRVIDSLFDPHFYISIIAQSAVHILTCALGWQLAVRHETSRHQMDGPFTPNLVNTVVFLMNAAQHASTFLGNYEGAPFLTSWRDFKVLTRTLVVFVLCIFFVAFEVAPDLNRALKLVAFPSAGFRHAIVALLAVDLFGAAAVGYLATKLGRMRQTALRARF